MNRAQLNGVVSHGPATFNLEQVLLYLLGSHPLAIPSSPTFPSLIQVEWEVGNISRRSNKEPITVKFISIVKSGNEVIEKNGLRIDENKNI